MMERYRKIRIQLKQNRPGVFTIYWHCMPNVLACMSVLVLYPGGEGDHDQDYTQDQQH